MASAARKRIRRNPAPGYTMRDFCSGGEEELMDADLHSPTDGSDDSVDVKVKPIVCGGSKSKRKCAEPRKFGEDLKRRKVTVDFHHNGSEGDTSPFRPWSHHPEIPSGYIPRGYQEEPLSLVLRDQELLRPTVALARGAETVIRPGPGPQEVVRLQPNLVKLEDYGSGAQDVEDTCNGKPHTFSVDSLIHDPAGAASSSSSLTASDRRKTSPAFQPQQRNYKNMTRERRIEANARERTRVHTISAAFDTLRRAVPAYSHNQKLSKLSVLRIACSYILTLSRVAGSDYSEDNSQPSLSDCVDNVSKTIQMEGKLRKKKDE